MNDDWLGHEKTLVANFDGEKLSTNGKRVYKKHIMGWAEVPYKR